MLWPFIVFITVIYYFLRIKISFADMLMFADMEDELPNYLKRHYWVFFSGLVKVLGGLIIFLPALDTNLEFWNFFTSVIIASVILYIIKYIAIAKGLFKGQDIFQKKMKDLSELYPDKKSEFLEMAKMEGPEITNRGKNWVNIINKSDD